MIILAALIYSQERHIVVAADGSGEFTSVQEAVNSIRAYMSDRHTCSLGMAFTGRR